MSNNDAFYLRFQRVLSQLSTPTSKNLISYMSLTYSITGLLVILGLLGKHLLATEVAVVQGAALATFYVLSGDARHLILSGKSDAINVVSFRLAWVLPLAFLAYFMSTTVGQVDHLIATSLVLRRATEWLAEPHVTEIERKNQKWSGFYIQPALFLALIIQIMITDEFWIVWLWAISPVLFSFKFMMQANVRSAFDFTWQNITSTAVIGFTGYIQRILIVSLVGKEFSGMLFPGFAIGSFLGTMAANVIGPTMINKGFIYNKLIIYFFAALLSTGLLTLFLSDTIPYQTMGLSIIGGVAMIAAQQSRLLLLKSDNTLELDLLFQLALVFSIPAIYFIGGPNALMSFYLTGSLLAWLFYRGSKMLNYFNKKWQLRLVVLIVLGLVLPVFFQLNGQIYNNPLIAMVDSGGSLQTVPLPISLLFCYVGVFLFIGGCNKSQPALLTIAAMFLLLVLSTIITNQGVAKLVLLAQYMLPTVALLLGVAVTNFDRELFPKVVLYFLTIFVPAQLIMTWLQGQLALTHYMYFFSVYSHFQYVPLIITVLFCWCLIQLIDKYPKWLLFLTPWMAMYVAAGNSTLALFGLIILAVSFALCHRKNKLISIIPIVVILSIAGYFYLNSKLAAEINQSINGTWACRSGLYNDGLNSPCKPGVFHGKFFSWDGDWLYGQNRKYQTAETTETFINLLERKNLASWYIQDMLKEPLSIVYGHPSPPPRSVASSAHNYYLDLIYNFGFFACLPLFFLILYTIVNASKQRNNDALIIWLLVIVMYVVIIDNNLKVSLRQPYPSILTFFLWGSLISRLKPSKSKIK